MADKRNINGNMNSLEEQERNLDISSSKNLELFVVFTVFLISAIYLTLSVKDFELLAEVKTFDLFLTALNLPIYFLHSVIPIGAITLHFIVLHNIRDHRVKFDKFYSSSIKVLPEQGHKKVTFRLFPFIYDITRMKYGLVDKPTIAAFILAIINCAVYVYLPCISFVLFFIRFADLQELWLSLFQLSLLIIDLIIVFIYWCPLRNQKYLTFKYLQKLTKQALDAKKNHSLKSLFLMIWRFVWNNKLRIVKYPFTIGINILRNRNLFIDFSSIGMNFSMIVFTGYIFFWVFIYSVAIHTLAFTGLAPTDSKHSETMTGWLILQADRQVEEAIRLENILRKLINISIVPRIEVISISHPDKNSLDLSGRNFLYSYFLYSKMRGLNINGANFSKARLTGVDFQNTSHDQVIFIGANLNSTKFQGASLNQVKFNFANLDYTNFQNATFKQVNFQGASLRETSLDQADLRKANFQGASLRDAELTQADLRESNLQGSYLNSAVLLAADLRNANLQGANLSFASLQGALMQEANLNGADLGFARLQGADMSQSSIQGADFSFSSTKGVIWPVLENNQDKLPAWLKLMNDNTDYNFNPLIENTNDNKLKTLYVAAALRQKDYKKLPENLIMNDLKVWRQYWLDQLCIDYFSTKRMINIPITNSNKSNNNQPEKRFIRAYMYNEPRCEPYIEMSYKFLK